MNNITFTVSPMSKPDDLSLKVSLAWDYYKFNVGERNWFCVETGDGGIIVTDEARNLSDAFVFPDYDSFLAWLESDATGKLAEDPAEYFRNCGVVPDNLLSDSVVQALLTTINAPGNAPYKPTVSPVSAGKNPEPPAPASTESKMQDYYVTFAINGRYTVKVEADSTSTAMSSAIDAFCDADFGELAEIESDPVLIEDERGNYVYEK